MDAWFYLADVSGSGQTIPMPADDDSWAYAIAALAAIGLGLAGYLALSAEQRRRAFREALRQALEANHIGFVESNLARVNDAPAWLVTINHPRTGIARYRVAFPSTTEPYSQSTLNAVIERLLTATEPVRQSG
jgi:hypothetical protein